VKYRFTRFWASLLEALGMVILAGGAILAVAIWLLPVPMPTTDRWDVSPWVTKASASLLLLVVAFLLGGPCIVLGQLLHAFLDQRRWLIRIHQRTLELAERQASERHHGDSQERSGWGR
jgi:hypothetical protein